MSALWGVAELLPTKEEMRAALAARHGRERQEKFSAAAVAVCGLGGLGSNIAIALARAGVGRLILIDFDRVDVTNLHRQQYKAGQVGRYKAEALAENLREIAPYIQLEPHTAPIEPANAPALLAGAEVVCEAFDDPVCKSMLTDVVLEQLPDAVLIGASGMAGLGSANRIQTRRVARRFYLCGDGVSAVGEGEGLYASRVMVCAAHQAHMVLRVLAGELEP